MKKLTILTLCLALTMFLSGCVGNSFGHSKQAVKDGAPLCLKDFHAYKKGEIYVNIDIRAPVKRDNGEKVTGFWEIFPFEEDILTARNIRIGSPVEAVKKAYAGIECVQENNYSENNNNSKYTYKYRGYELVFVIEDGKVTRIEASTQDYRDWLEDYVRKAEELLSGIRDDDNSGSDSDSGSGSGSGSSETAGQKNAVSKARSCLSSSAFSRDGLVAQLEFSKFSHEDAVYGADHSGANWNEQALRKAGSYLSSSAFSRDGLIGQLEFSKFTHAEAVYGVDNCGANWNDQALKQARAWLNVSAFSRDGLVAQLEFAKFTHAEALYGADNCGADWNEQAARKARLYLSTSPFSRDNLINQLVYEKFTRDQAIYGVNAAGL